MDSNHGKLFTFNIAFDLNGNFIINMNSSTDSNYLTPEGEYKLKEIKNNEGENSSKFLNENNYNGNDMSRNNNYHPHITINNVSGNDFSQNSKNNINISQKYNYENSIKNLSKLINKVKAEDKQQAFSLLNRIKEETSNNKYPKKGFLKRFNDLFGKYSNITDVVGKILLEFALHKF